MTATARKQPAAHPIPQPIAAPVKPPARAEKQSMAPERSDYETKMLVRAMAQEGHSTAEIAKTLDISPQAVSSRMIRDGAGRGRKGATRSIRVRIPLRFFRVLKLLAEERNASPSAALSQVIKGALPDLPTARKMVRKG